MAQLDVLLIVSFIFGLIPILFLHYVIILRLIIPSFLGVRKMRNKKIK